MKIKIFLLIGAFSFLQFTPLLAKKIYCKKFSGKYNNWELHVIFNHKGKMFVKADIRKKGWTSQLGSYKYKRNKLKAFLHSKQREFKIKPKKYLVGTPYSFDLANDHKTKVRLNIDKQFKCKKK